MIRRNVEWILAAMSKEADRPTSQLTDNDRVVIESTHNQNYDKNNIFLFESQTDHPPFILRSLTSVANSTRCIEQWHNSHIPAPITLLYIVVIRYKNGMSWWEYCQSTRTSSKQNLRTYSGDKLRPFIGPVSSLSLPRETWVRMHSFSAATLSLPI